MSSKTTPSKCAYIKCKNIGTKKCSCCKIVYYCSPECQKLDWPLHKNDCKFCSICSSKLTESATLCPCQGSRICPSCVGKTKCFPPPEIKIESESECCVCMESNKKFTKLPCNHAICTDCWLKIDSTEGKCCPVCRNFISICRSLDLRLSPDQLQKLIIINKKMIKYIRNIYEHPSFKKSKMDPFNTLINFSSFLTGIIQYSSTDYISENQELYILEKVFNIIYTDKKCLYFTLLRYQIEEEKRGNTPMGMLKHRLLSNIPALYGSTIEENKKTSDAIYKFWDIFMSLEPE